MKVILAGTFDLLHEGHKELFEFTKRVFGKIDRVYVTTDEFVAAKKTVQQPQNKRWLATENYLGKNTQIEYISSKQDFIDSIKQEAPCTLIHGNDHNADTLSEIYGVEPRWWTENNIFLMYKDRCPGISSTELREKVDFRKGFLESITGKKVYECTNLVEGK